MYSSTRSGIVDKIVEFIRQNRQLFDQYIEVYLFGSVLKNYEDSHDVDLLLVFDGDVDGAIENIDIISCELGRVCELPIDLTILSSDEEIETQFLKRLDAYLQLK